MGLNFKNSNNTKSLSINFLKGLSKILKGFDFYQFEKLGGGVEFTCSRFLSNLFWNEK